MMEDKLEQEQRIKLEALNQAISSYAHIPQRDAVTNAEIIKRAREFENYVKGVEDNGKEQTL